MGEERKEAGLYQFIFLSMPLICTTEWAKNHATLLLSIFSPIIDRFSKFFSLAHFADSLQ